MPRPRLPRSRSFFGVHFDFHANHHDPKVGGRDFAKTLKEFLRRVRPDYVQCDCKGHPGITSYPTRVGTTARGLTGDPLRVWRRVTADAGVALYVHYSGVMDRAAIAAHPGWARVDENGKRDELNTSVFGPYADRLMIPQLQEVWKEYGVEGFWIDGDCWATARDYGKKALAAFRKSTGIDTVPRSPQEPHYAEFTEFCREGFRQYLRHYVDQIHARCPGAEIASNWAFSSFMPEPVCADVDFLSGDIIPGDSVRSARLEARALMHQGKPWDLMAWGFDGTRENGLWQGHGRTSKTALQLQQEAAVVLSLGGGFQVYLQQRRDASICEHDIPVMEEVARFCRRRRRWCQGAESVPQVALLYSGTSAYQTPGPLFHPGPKGLPGLRGVLYALLENQYPVDILSEHHLRETLHRYPLVVIPEWSHLEEAFRARLLDYVREGGNLLVIGAKSLPLFSKELGVTIAGEGERKSRWIGTGRRLAGIESEGIPIRPRRGTETVLRAHSNNDLAAPAEPVAVRRRLGKGWIAGLSLDFGTWRFERSSAQMREMFAKLVAATWDQPAVRIKGSSLVDVTLMRKNGKTLVHLVNTAGPHAQEEALSYDEIPAIGPLDITLNLPETPASIRLQPEGKELAFERQGRKGRSVTVRLPQLSIHSILEVIPA